MSLVKDVPADTEVIISSKRNHEAMFDQILVITIDGDAIDPVLNNTISRIIPASNKIRRIVFEPRSSYKGTDQGASSYHIHSNDPSYIRMTCDDAWHDSKWDFQIEIRTMKIADTFEASDRVIIARQ